MFCAVIVAVLLFVFYSFIPWTKRIVSESTRVAHLLAEVSLAPPNYLGCE